MKRLILRGCPTDLPEPLHGEQFDLEQDPEAYGEDELPEATGAVEVMPTVSLPFSIVPDQNECIR